MGFRPPKASIADRLMLTKRKMEEVKEAPVQPAASMPHTIVSSSTADFQGFHGAAKFSVGAPRNPPAVAAFPATAPVTSATLVTLKPPGSSPVKPVTNPSVPLPHTGPSHVKLDKGVNGPLNLARSGATVGHFNKSLHDTSARSNLNTAQSSNQVMKNKDTKAVNTEVTTGNPLMGHNAAAGVASGAAKPHFANHNEIAKNVQNFLRQPANHPIWTPPSTEYMHSRLDCQICKVAIMDVESLLVCDSCEKGAHLKCLQHYGNKGVPKAEWHCPTCLTRSKGKPLPPKYGKVTRTVVDPKTAPPPGGTQLSSQGEANHAAKENPEKMVTNGNILKPNSMEAGGTVHNSTVLARNVTAAGSQSQSQSQSQSSSTSRTPEGNFNNTGSSSNDKDENVGQCSIKSQHNKISDELQSSELPAVSNTGTHSGKFRNEQLPSVLALYSVDATNNTLNGQKSTAISGVTCSDNSFVVAAEENIKPEAQSELVPSRSVKMVDIGVTPMYQTNSIATLANSQPHTMKDVEVITNTGTPIDQGGNVSAEEKLQTTSEPHPIKDVAVTTNTGTPIDQNSNAASEVKPLSEPTNAIEIAEMATNAGIPPNQFQQANGSAENDRKECANGETDKDKSYCNEMSDVGMTPQLESNGVIHPKDAAREEAI